MLTGLVDELGRFLRASLVTRVPRDHRETDAAILRRRVVCAVTLVAGAVLLGLSLGLPPGSGRFYPYTLLLATVWTMGSLASGKIYMGQAHTRRGDHDAVPVVQSLALAALLLGVFLVGAVAVAQVALLRGAVNEVLDHARFGSLPVVTVITVVNGLAEELFFRGALFSAVPERHQISVSTVLYMLVTLASGNVMLVFAAALIGTVVALQRRATGGVLGPMVTHVVWSSGMLFLLPSVLEMTS